MATKQAMDKAAADARRMLKELTQPAPKTTRK